MLLLCVSCKNDPKPEYNANFADRAINFALQNSENTIELPGLHPYQANAIPSESNETWELADKLLQRGFRETARKTETWELSHKTVISVFLSNGNCDCQVSKIYRGTAYVSRYDLSENITCINR